MIAKHPQLRLLLHAAALLLLLSRLLVARPARADETPTFELTIEHHNEARVFVRTIEDAPTRADYAPLQAVAQAPESRRWPGWLTLGTGAVAVGIGGALAATAAQDAASLRQAVLASPLQFATAAAQQQAVTQAALLKSQLTIGMGVAAAGAVGVGVGAWLLLRQPWRHAVVLPTGQGAQLTVAF